MRVLESKGSLSGEIGKMTKREGMDEGRKKEEKNKGEDHDQKRMEAIP